MSGLLPRPTPPPHRRRVGRALLRAPLDWLSPLLRLFYEPLTLASLLCLLIYLLGAALSVFPPLGSFWGGAISRGELLLLLLFSASIKRGLYGLGRALLRLTARPHLAEESRGELLDAVASLQRLQIGALIVLEQSQRLDRWVDDSIVLNATLSSELLYSLFIPALQNPCHDGAVILRARHGEAQILCAGAFFPISQQPLEQRYGTRHRAGVGISERTDACVILVSEERRDISWVEGGKLSTVKDLEELALLIQRTFRTPR